MNYPRRYTRAVIAVSAAFLTACASAPKPDPESCLGEKFLDVGFFGIGSVGHDQACADARTSYTLLKRISDPIGNALGLLLYFDQSPKAKELLEERMGGKDKVKIAPETVAGLLLSGDETSRYVGFQIYAASPEDTRKNVNKILEAEKADPKAILALDLSRERSTAMAWAREHALAPANSPATIARLKRDDCTKTRTASGVTWSCPKPAAPAAQ